MARQANWMRLHLGDARSLGQLLPARECLDATITSPPYGPVVDYGVPGQIGYGQSHRQYLEDIRSIFDVLFKRTKQHGSLWLIADTFKEPTHRGVSRVVPLPFELSLCAEDCGWVLQDIIIWQKDRTLPWSHRGRFRNTFEYVLFLVKGPDFKYRIDRVKNASDIKDWWVRYPERYGPLGVSPSNLWQFPIPVQGSWSLDPVEHRCPLPRGLVERIVELCTDPRDVICDPFAGVGTVLAVAASLRRKFVGVELVPAYVDQFYSVTLPGVSALKLDGPTKDPAGQDDYRLAIAVLRHSKLPKMLVRLLRRAGVPVVATIVRAQVSVASADEPSNVGSQVIEVFVPDGLDVEALRASCSSLLKRPPLSKFGIRASACVRPVSAWRRPHKLDRWSLIPLGTTLLPEALNGQRLKPSIQDPPLLIDVAAGDLARTIRSVQELGETSR